MDHGIIGMPFDMAMESELSRRQFYDRAQKVLADCKRNGRMAANMVLDIVAVGESLGIPGEEQDGGVSEFIDAIEALTAERDQLRAEVEALRKALGRICTRTEAFMADGSDMSIHSVEMINGIASAAMAAKEGV